MTQSNDPGTPPDIREELERKTMTELERILFGLHVGKLTKRAAMAQLQVVWGIVAGLVSKETMELIAATDAEIKAQLETLLQPDEAVVIKATPGSGGVNLVAMRFGPKVLSLRADSLTNGFVDFSTADKGKHVHPELAARQFLLQIHSKDNKS